MADYFALFELPRSVWIEPTEVKARFAELAATAHPDRVHQSDEAIRKSATDRYSELNSACQTLSDTRLRLKHLIELETGESPSDIGNVPAHISDLFFKVGQVFQKADQTIKARDAKASPMVQAGWMAGAMDQVDALRGLQTGLTEHLEKLDERCRALGESRSTGDPATLKELARLYRDYSYLNKWLDQVREKQLQLTL
jgi:DnaJ-domain-containing protein 1